MVVYMALLCLSIIIVYLLHLCEIKFNYWKKRGVCYVKPSFIFGNYKKYILLQKPIGHVVQEICETFPNELYIGSYYGTDPALIIQNPKLIKLIMSEDFKYFNGREMSKYCYCEKFTNSMFFLGGDDWKILRKNMTSLFSSGNMKNMFYLIQDCRETFEKVLKKEISESPDIETKCLVTRYIIDCIGSCVFGLNSNALTTDIKSNPFMLISEEMLKTTTLRRFKFVVRSMWPSILYGLRLQYLPEKVTDFFQHVLTQVFESRTYKQTNRHDLVDLLLTWEKEIHYVESNLNENKHITLKVDNNLLVSQCTLFYAAGHETSASTLTYYLYELAKNRNAQKKLIDEIDVYLEKNNGKVEYNCLTDLPYLAAGLDETLRLYPLFAILTRETMHDYTLPSGLRLEKGLRIHIPVYHLHRDPKYFPDPEQFYPERFLEEEKKKLTPYIFLPFGEGPRACIGMRLSKMQIYPAVVTIFKDYEVELMDGMQKELNFVIGAITTQTEGGVYLKFTKRIK